MNNRLLELKAEIKQHKLDAEKLEDASAELMMNTGGDSVMLLIGESFIEVSEDYATECKNFVNHLSLSIYLILCFTLQIVRRSLRYVVCIAKLIIAQKYCSNTRVLLPKPLHTHSTLLCYYYYYY